MFSGRTACLQALVVWSLRASGEFLRRTPAFVPAASTTSTFESRPGVRALGLTAVTFRCSEIVRFRARPACRSGLPASARPVAIPSGSLRSSLRVEPARAAGLSCCVRAGSLHLLRGGALQLFDAARAPPGLRVSSTIVSFARGPPASPSAEWGVRQAQLRGRQLVVQRQLRRSRKASHRGTAAARRSTSAGLALPSLHRVSRSSASGLTHSLPARAERGRRSTTPAAAPFGRERTAPKSSPPPGDARSRRPHAGLPCLPAVAGGRAGSGRVRTAPLATGATPHTGAVRRCRAPPRCLAGCVGVRGKPRPDLLRWTTRLGRCGWLVGGHVLARRALRGPESARPRLRRCGWVRGLGVTNYERKSTSSR